jgi:urease accessory protein
MTTVLDRRTTGQVGRHARLELVFAVRDGRTMLAHSYAEPPFRSGRWFAEGSGLHMILASSSPGMFGGDVLDQSIVVEAGARVRLTSQSAPQLHASADGAAAVVRSSYRVAGGAHLSCHWDPLIPFPGSSLDQRVEVALDQGASLYWSDALMNGRQARGEGWRFASIAHELRICRGGELAYLERCCLAPSGRPASHRWVAADAAFFGTTIAAGGAGTGSIEAQRLHATLAATEGVTASADALGESLLVVRVMSALGVPFHEARALTREALGGR